LIGLTSFLSHQIVVATKEDKRAEKLISVFPKQIDFDKRLFFKLNSL
jgi:hypothetical protein